MRPESKIANMGAESMIGQRRNCGGGAEIRNTGEGVGDNAMTLLGQQATWVCITASPVPYLALSQLEPPFQLQKLQEQSLYVDGNCVLESWWWAGT